MKVVDLFQDHLKMGTRQTSFVEYRRLWLMVQLAIIGSCPPSLASWSSILLLTASAYWSAGREGKVGWNPTGKVSRLLVLG